jgi:hypothetical protein
LSTKKVRQFGRSDSLFNQLIFAPEDLVYHLNKFLTVKILQAVQVPVILLRQNHDFLLFLSHKASRFIDLNRTGKNGPSIIISAQINDMLVSSRSNNLLYMHILCPFAALYEISTVTSNRSCRLVIGPAGLVRSSQNMTLPGKNIGIVQY